MSKKKKYMENKYISVIDVATILNLRKKETLLVYGIIKTVFLPS